MHYRWFNILFVGTLTWETNLTEQINQVNQVNQVNPTGNQAIPFFVAQTTQSYYPNKFAVAGMLTRISQESILIDDT